MNDIFYKFVNKIKEPVKIFTTRNIQEPNYDLDNNFSTDDIASSDEEPKLYTNNINKNNLIKIFEEIDYSDELIYNLKPKEKEIQAKKVKLKQKNIKNKCKKCGLYLINGKNNYLKINYPPFYLKYNELKGIYHCGCEEKVYYINTNKLMKELEFLY